MASYTIYKIDKKNKTTVSENPKSYKEYIQRIAEIESEDYFKFGYAIDINEQVTVNGSYATFMIHDKN